MMNPSEDKTCREIVKYVREVANPRRIVLFGSRARGDGDEDSDYDILVVKDEVKSHQEESHQIRVALMALPIFVDVFLRTTAEDEQKQQLQIGLQKSLMEEGVVLYERGGDEIYLDPSVTNVAKEFVQTLLRKVEIDLLNATILRDSNQGNPEGIGFHVQQAVEKSLKAILVFYGIDYPRTHSIAGLARLVSDNNIDLPNAFLESNRYTSYARDLRYDGIGPNDAFDFDEAIAYATDCVSFAKSLLGDALT